MTDLATFKGTYSDIKLIRSRKVAMIHVEIPIEAAAAFVAVFGMPNPAEETWIALARMNTMESTPKPKRVFSELPLPQQAALACKREAFWKFIAERCDIQESHCTEIQAAQYVREFCNIESRSELARNEVAADLWEELYEAFQLWLRETDI